MKKILKFCFNTNNWSPTKTEWLNLLYSLPKKERDRIAGYAYKRDCKQTLIGQLLIRYCVRSLLDCKWNHISIEYDSNRRPFLNLGETIRQGNLKNMSKTTQIDFNYTHNGDYTAIVAALDTMSSNFRIGTDIIKIDVERSKKENPHELNTYNLYENELNRYSRIINAKFSESEKAYISHRSNSIEKLTAFYRLWCLKESYLKALGEGIKFELKRVEFQISNDLFIDLTNKQSQNDQKCLVVTSSQVIVDSKLVKNCKFYEQYYLNRTKNNDATNHLSELYILTFCIIENEHAFDNSKNINAELLEEFKEINLADILNINVPLEQMNQASSDDIEKNWTDFDKKPEKPF